MTDAEADFGITHNDHFETESWRVEQVRRIEAGIPNMNPPEIDYAERPSRRHSFWIALVLWFAIAGSLVLMVVTNS